MEFINNYIISKHQRYNMNNNFIDKIIVKLTKRYYKKLFTNSNDRKRLSKALWAGDGGFAHANTQFNRSDDDWLNIYDDFYKTFFHEFTSEDILLEIGCSMGQWAKRLKLNETNNKYLGIDINPKSIESAQNIFKDYNNIKFQCVDLNDGFCFEPYNMIICVQVLFFLDIKLIKKIFNNVKLGTKVIISEPINNLQQKNSEELKSINSVGFSHRYIDIFESLNYFIDKKLILEREAGNVEKRITIVAVKQ